jgi:hypothetical protein
MARSLKANRFVWILAAVAVVAALAFGVKVVFFRDPLAALPREIKSLQTDCRDVVGAGRRLRHVTLSDPRLGLIAFTVSLPDPIHEEKLPLVVVLGGIGTGAENIRSAEGAGENAIVGYDWPLPTEFPKGLKAVEELPALRRKALSVPGQVSTMLDWLVRQPWSDSQRISLLGFSLGAIAVPAAERMAQQGRLPVRWTVLAYGGIGLAALVKGDQRIEPGWERPILGEGMALLLWPLEPARHLPGLHGHFLILGASSDEVVDRRSSSQLEALAPEPKTIIHTAGEHIGTGRGRSALLEEAVTITRHWLAAEGAIN